jgi:hypothetical protein
MMARKLPLFDGFIETPLNAGFRACCVKPGTKGVGMSLWQSQALAKRWVFATSGMRQRERQGWSEGSVIQCWR